MRKKAATLCADSALLYIVLTGTGLFLVMGWFPPLSPALNAQEILEIFVTDRTRIRIGCAMLLFASVLFLPVSALLSAQLKRIEGDFSPLSYINLLCAAFTSMCLFLAPLCWLVAAYRPEAHELVVHILSDLGWYFFVGPYPPVFLQALVVGVGILSDERKEPSLPRWAGYASLWFAFLYLPAALIPFFPEGPFSWNGILSFWIAGLALGGWMNVMWFVLRQQLSSEFPSHRANASEGLSDP